MSEQNKDWKERSKSFDDVANLYDQYRPAYPDELVQTILGMLPKQSAHILEIGCGTGKATTLFAKHGHHMLCVEPGENLAAVAQRNVKAYPQVKFEIARFEDWAVQESRFDLAISAQAFHWVPKDVGFAKIATALKGNGRIALFWNMYPDPKGDIFTDLDAVYREVTPELVKPPGASYENVIAEKVRDIEDSGLFDNLTVHRFPWTETNSTTEYLGLLNTYSDHLRLSDKKREALFASVASVINKHGGTIEKPYLAVLYTAVKKS